MSEKKTMTQLRNELVSATEALERAIEHVDTASREESVARSLYCSAKNQLNEAQKAFDRVQDEIRKLAVAGAGRDSDWNDRTRRAREVPVRPVESA